MSVSAPKPSTVSGDKVQPPSMWVDGGEFSNNLDEDEVDIKAVKMDDAVVPVGLWNRRILENPVFPVSTNVSAKHLDILRGVMLIWWKRRVLRSLINYLHTEWPQETKLWMGGYRGVNQEFINDVEAGKDCLHYTSSSDWWTWRNGSRLLFWQWVGPFKDMARDGVPVYWVPNKKPTSRELQPQVTDEETKMQMREKLAKVRKQGYIRPGKVKSLIKYFSVPKGEEDIRIVYDGTASGFNDAVWTPNFGLPTIESLLRSTGPTTWMVDLDIGEMFLNFMMHKEARQLVGVDITPLFPEEVKAGKHVVWERWERCGMGLKFSPYQTIRMLQVAEEFVVGRPDTESNPFHYSAVKLNLPGTKEYKPGMPWFMVVTKDGDLAAALAIYVDDERIHASSCEQAWACAHQVATREAYLGIQDAARKRRPPSQKAGAWAGSIVRSNGLDVGIMTSDERWRKAKDMVWKWHERLSQSPDISLNTKELRSDRGFLIYITRTYKCLNTFLKGIHLTIDGWRSQRDDDGWRYIGPGREGLDVRIDEANAINGHDYPEIVEPVSRLIHDLEALKSIMTFEQAPVVLVHTSKIYMARYGFGDASGSGFGSSIETPDGMEVRYGTWNEKGSAKSSNFRELGNLIMALEEEAEAGRLAGVELFIFTDNTTAESAFHTGTSSSKTLFELVVRVKRLELSQSLKLHVIHVAGKRMIKQGTDGLSRGNFLEGVMSGSSMLEFVPISLTAINRSRSLLPWIREWTGSNKLTPLKEVEWLTKGQCLSHDIIRNSDGVEFPREAEDDVLLWTPPPCIADIGLEYLRKSIHKRPDRVHVMIIPKLMTHLWRKNVLKTCDLSFYIDVGHPCWPEEMCESILVALYLPLLHCHPWTLRRTKSVLEVERQVRYLQKREAGAEVSILWQFLLFTRRLRTMPDGMVWGLLSKGTIR